MDFLAGILACISIAAWFSPRGTGRWLADAQDAFSRKRAALRRAKHSQEQANG